jgi:predicted PurR-regulated permease PerM
MGVAADSSASSSSDDARGSTAPSAAGRLPASEDRSAETARTVAIGAASPAPAIRTSLAIAIVFTLIGVSAWIVLPFIGAIIWGAIIAISVYPAHLRLTASLGGRRKLSAIIIGLLVAALLFTPLVLLFLTAGEQVSKLADALANLKELTVPPPPAWLSDIPLIGRRLSNLWDHAQTDLAGSVEAIRPQLRAAILWTASRVAGSALTVLEAALAIVTASVFLITGPRLKAFFTRLLFKLGAIDSAALVVLIERTVHGVSRGIVGTAFIQAVVLGLGFAIAGVPFPVLFAFLALILCSIQVGAMLIGLPLAAWMWSQGDTGTAGFVLGWTLFINVLDNFLKPILIGRDFPVPIWVGFLGVIGGLLAMGLIGLFIGPIALGVCYRLLIDWIKE